MPGGLNREKTFLKRKNIKPFLGYVEYFYGALFHKFWKDMLYLY